MRTQEVLDPEDLFFDETSILTAAMTLPDLRRYSDNDEEEDDDELGLRMLLENPLALSRSFRRQLH